MRSRHITPCWPNSAVPAGPPNRLPRLHSGPPHNRHRPPPRSPTKSPATTPAAPVVVAQTAHKDLHDNTTATATILAVPEQLDFAAIAAGVLA